MNILSVDFDYFLDCTIETRNNKFPNGVDLLPENELKKQWEYFYKKYPEIKEIEVIDQFNEFCRSLKTLIAHKVIVSDSHSDIWNNVIQLVPINELIVLEHIDFHHDNYISGGTKIDCANWVRHLMEERPNTQIIWEHREDSDIASLIGNFPYPMHKGIHLGHLEYDYIFFCFSPEWSLPHLKEEFNYMVSCVNLK